VKERQRRLSSVPLWLWTVLAATLFFQIAWQSTHPRPAPSAADLPMPPSAGALRVLSFGEAEAAARIAMLYLQAFDLGGSNAVPYRTLDYSRLVAWLKAILDLDPRSQYPLFAAARIYAEVPDPSRSRMALEFVYEEFLRDPDRRWPWLAHAALVAKHRLGDLPLALRYAAAIDERTTTEGVPLWAKQMQVFILEDMNELQAAKIMLGGLLESGAVRDPAEARFLRDRLQEMEEKLTKKAGRNRQ
jgi:hypothetical protein